MWAEFTTKVEQGGWGWGTKTQQLALTCEVTSTEFSVRPFVLTVSFPCLCLFLVYALTGVSIRWLIEIPSLKPLTAAKLIINFMRGIFKW